MWKFAMYYVSMMLLKVLTDDIKDVCTYWPSQNMARTAGCYCCCFLPRVYLSHNRGSARKLINWCHDLHLCLPGPQTLPVNVYWIEYDCKYLLADGAFLAECPH